ncbi:MAG: acyl-CoA dehydrogenase family protein [Candidatus Promineifilaceae bacterium]
MMTPVELGKKVSAELASRADESNKNSKLNPADIQSLTESGFSALSLPKEYGGHGASLRDCVAAMLELAQGNPSTALIAGMQMHVFGHNREVRSWNEAKFEEFCQITLEQGGLFNSIATEPALGSPSRGQIYKTSAEKTDGGYLLNGLKTWSTGGEYLTHLLVRASVGKGIGVLAVENNSAGVEWEYTWRDVLSFRASESHDVHFKACPISAENLIEYSEGPTKSRPNLWFAQVMSSIYLGAAIAARNTVVRYALERVPTALGRPISTLPKIQRQIGEIDVQLQAARALLLEVAGEWSGRDEDRAALAARNAAAKVMATETARDVTDKALRIAGGVSLTTALPLERHFRDVRAGSMQPPSGDTALEIVGRAAISQLADQK